jgi:hypothetical protein
MKKMILTVAAVFALGLAQAQDSNKGEGFGKGSMYLSGTANFSRENVDGYKVDNLIIAPGIGYFLTENLALEGSLAYLSGKAFNSSVGYEAENSGMGINAGVRYFWTPASKFSLSLGGNISYASIKTEVPSIGVDFTSKVIGVNVPVGLHYFVSDSFAITSTWGGLGYSTNDNGGNGAEKTNEFSFGLDMSAINFGLIYKL